ncbi:MAG: hypothetical protein H6Q36_1496 [Chloroflexi bacterium]|nr:hypothetical protein [Chloroflexota bacterium]
MRALATIVGLVVIGIIAAWVGYWIGHALGWTTGAEFPLTIGGGAWAIGLSILVSFGCVMAGVGLFVARPLRNVRRLAASGTPGRATVRRVWRTGFSMTPAGGSRQRLIAFELEMHPDGGGDYGAKATGLLTEAQEAALAPGTEAAVRFDPAHRSSVAVVGPMPTPAG